MRQLYTLIYYIVLLQAFMTIMQVCAVILCSSLPVEESDAALVMPCAMQMDRALGEALDKLDALVSGWVI